MVGRTGSFTRAAEQMHVAQSAVSSQVAALEDYVEEQLLLRTNRSVELTDIGRELLGYAHAIFAQSSAINALIKDKDKLRGQVTTRLGIVGGASRNFVYRLIVNYHQKSPSTRLSVSTGSYPELYRLLRRHQLEAIITLDLPEKKHMTEVSYQKLGESRICIVGTPKVMKRLRRKDLGKPVEVFKFRHPFEIDVLSKYIEPRVSAPLRLAMDTDDIPLLRFFANSGQGVAILPKVGVLEDLEEGNVEAIEVPRCPEVNIYGITTIHRTMDVDANPSLALWDAVESSLLEAE